MSMFAQYDTPAAQEREPTPLTNLDEIRDRLCDDTVRLQLTAGSAQYQFELDRKPGRYRRGEMITFVVAQRGSRNLYAGTIFPNGEFRTTKRSKLTARDVEFRVFATFYAALRDDPEQLQRELDAGNLAVHAI